MNFFKLSLLDNRGAEFFENVIEFIGSESEGSFGIRAGHIHTVIILRYGLARFKTKDNIWHYFAVPGGVFHFTSNQLIITAVRYFLGENRQVICQQLTDEMARQDSEVHSARAMLTEIEHTLVLRMTKLAETNAAGIG